MTRLSGWCSPCCSPRAHATCQDRLDRGLLKRCDCAGHPAVKAAPTCGDTVESGTKRGPDRANESDPLATVSTRPKGA